MQEKDIEISNFKLIRAFQLSPQETQGQVDTNKSPINQYAK